MKSFGAREYRWLNTGRDQIEDTPSLRGASIGFRVWGLGFRVIELPPLFLRKPCKGSLSVYS